MEKKEPKMRFGDLRAILNYVPLFRGKRFVVAVDGAILDEGRMADLLLDMAVLQSLNIHVILIHGASRQIVQLAEERGVTLSSPDGTGETNEATLQVSIDAITRLTNQLQEQATVSSIRIATANALVAHKAGVVKGLSQGFTGVIDRVDTACINAFLTEGLLPIISPIGYDRQGQTLRLNSDSVATEVALALKASKILFITHAKVTEVKGNRVRQLSVEKAFQLSQKLADSPSPSPALSKLKHASRACREGISRVHIIDGGERDALLAELFNNEGTGTMVYADAYQEIRSATQTDIPIITSMIRPSVTDEDLAPRDARDVEDALQDFSVIEIDGNVVGCVALHSYTNEKAVELACLFVHRNHENHGYGRKLMEFAARKARNLKASTLFALTTGASGFFVRLGGFEEGDTNMLPKARRERLESSGRRSQVMVLDLTAAPVSL